jgi:MFS family permease
MQSEEMEKESLNKKLWPVMLVALNKTLDSPWAWFLWNMVVISNLFWPGDPFHATEMALWYGTIYIIGACSRFIYGSLADRFSRVKILSINQILPSFMSLLYAFTPVGLGNVSFAYFYGIAIIREFFTGENPVINSFIDDAVFEKNRSKAFGLIQMISQFVCPIMAILCAIFFKDYWRLYFIIVGIIGVASGFVILMKGKDPKRASERPELKNILKTTEFAYKYQINVQTIKSTFLSRTNLVAFFEGIFSQIMLSVPQFLTVTYLQSAPHNWAPLTMTLYLFIFSIPGMFVGNIFLAPKSDKYATKNLKNRIKIIMGSMFIFDVLWLIVYLVPLPAFTPYQGENLGIILSSAPIIFIGILYLIGNAFTGLYNVNQKPLLQKVNLPEAQGAISSANQFLETIGVGVGVLISGGLLALYGGNYQFTVLTLMIVGFVGIFLWSFAVKSIEGDTKRISDILIKRSEEIANKKTDK